MIRQLRDFQQADLAAADGEWESGVTRTAIVHATGLGKGDLIAKRATDEVTAGGRVLVLTHRAEIMGQIAARCPLYLPGVKVGQVQAERNEIRRPIIVAMVPTLAARLRAVRDAQVIVDDIDQPPARRTSAQRELMRRKARLPQKPTLIVADECHHSISKSHMEVLTWAGAFDHVRTLGLTATLVRGDKRGLGDVWESVAAERDIGWAVENGWLVTPRGRAVVTDHVDLEHAKVSKGDYQDGELGEMVEQDTAQIVTAWREHAAERITVAFCPTVASATALRDEFQAVGVPAGLVLGTTPAEARRRAYARLTTGEDRVLCSVMVPTEGWDCPPVSCILQCRPTRLPGLYQQMVGRGLRLHPESGKQDCLVLDVVGASRHQRLATLIDLHKSAEYDDSEIEKVPEICPCTATGDLDRPGVLVKDCPCRQPCADCQCRTAEPGEGGTGDSGRRRLIGPAEYEDVDLFVKSKLSWLFTKAGTRFLPAGDRIAVLWDNGDETYAVGHLATKAVYDRSGVHHDDQVISLREDLDYGRRLAESWAMDYAPTVARRNASWRKRGGRPSEKQVNWARSLGIPSPETMTKPRLSDEISIVLASRVLDRF